MSKLVAADLAIDDIGDVAESQGAHAAFNATYSEHYQRLVKALRLAGSKPEEAEDLAQEAFIRTFARWPRVSRGDNPPGYVYRTAFRLQRSRLRRTGLKMYPFKDQLTVLDHEDLVVTSETLAAALQRLSPQQRRVVALCIYLEMSPNEAASILKLRPGTTRVHLYDARKILQHALRA